ncbi:MAG: DUF1385 domain-containing protein [Dehalococcoidia bacterium]|nr:MAG: DUF1385 domain-containing protein [Dehalococcoidia bacterium]
MARDFRYGGQAVMEGVMMLGRKTSTTAVRRPNGEIAINSKPRPKIYTGRLRQIPFSRGIIVLIESLILGINSLFYSANIALEEEGENVSSRSTWLILGLSFALAISLFFVAPLFLTKMLDPYIESSILFHLVEGAIRLCIFLTYLKLISLLPDIKRTFGYHGAEHKTVNAYEGGVELEARAIKEYSTAHTRCGTAFLLAVLIIAIVVFALVGRHAVWIMVVSRIFLIPVIAALGYEATQFGARNMNNILIRALMTPGLWLQGLTTREPDEGQIEVAVVALKEVLAADKQTLEQSTIEVSS